MSIINLATLEKQNEILSYFPVNTGFNPKDYDYIVLEGSSALTDYQTILDITGAGFLTKALARYGNPTSGQARIRITIDGVIVAHTRIVNKDMITGFTLEENLNVYGSNLNQLGDRVGRVFKQITGGLIEEMPFSDYTDGTNDINATFLQYPLFFNNSCKVEVYFVGSSTGYWTVMGGIEI